MDVELIGVPFDGYGRDGNHAKASQVLREAGLSAELGPYSVNDQGDLELPAFESIRGIQTGLLNEPALLAMTDLLNQRVRRAVLREKFPVVHGADCSLLLGVITGLRDAIGKPGLMFFDGHEDTTPLDVVEDGEAANCEIGLLLGLTGRLLTGTLAARLPALDLDALAMLGQHDADLRRQFNLASLAELGVWSQTLSVMRRAPGQSARAAAHHLRRVSTGWWLHVDLDVLDPRVFGAQGLPDDPVASDGLDIGQLSEAVAVAAGAGGCVGLSVTLYDPDQDPDRHDANQVVRLIRTIVQAHV